MKKIVLIIAIAFSLFFLFDKNSYFVPAPDVINASDEKVISGAFQNRQSNTQVKGRGLVIRILADDTDGSRHQKFIIKLSSGQTLLVSHNIDLAPRIESLKKGDMVDFYGEYEWNSKGGVIHWTHHDPRGSHPGGWLKHNGVTYQ